MRRFLLSMLVVFAIDVSPLPAADAPNWDSWRFLMGEWIGEGAGQPGQGSGSFSFALDLQGKVLVRRNRADYPATQDRPAFSHEDLMVVYQESGASSTRAIYFDNEGHVIHYAAKVSDRGDAITFLSDPSSSAPRFRLTYTKVKAEAQTIKFEIAPPDKPDAFSTYIEATARRKK